MKTEILQLIKDKPKHYVTIIKHNAKYKNWVEINTLSITEHWPSKIYSAVYQVKLECINGSTKKVSRWNDGLQSCGPSAICDCTKQSISEKVSRTKSSNTIEEKQKTNIKRNNTMLEKYGVEYNSQRPEIKHIWQSPKISEDALCKLSDKEWLVNEYQTNQRSSVDIADELGVYYSTVASYCISHGLSIRRRSSYSMEELEIKRYIETLGITVEQSNWSVLGNKEIDLYLPDLNIGIEIDGLYWHSYNPSLGKNENQAQHIEKTEQASEKQIKLIHVTDWEWNNKQEIIKSIIRNKLNMNQTILYARKCNLQPIPTKEARVFFEANHIQGFISAPIYLGLYFDNELVMAISSGRNRYTKNDDSYELYRMASKLNTSVIGGGSKLIKHLARQIDNRPLITYCDRSKFDGSGYQAIGFTLERISSPGYFWTKGNEMISRYQTRKNRLVNWLPSYDSNKSETENMFAANFRRFWDCGNYVFKLIQ